MLSDSVLQSIVKLQAAQSKQASGDAYNVYLSAIGNNHEGTYTRQAVDSIPAMLPLLLHGGAWCQHAVLEAFIDLLGCFGPCTEPDGSSGSGGEELSAALTAQIQALAPVVAQIAAQEGPAASSAQELLELLVPQDGEGGQ